MALKTSAHKRHLSPLLIRPCESESHGPAWHQQVWRCRTARERESHILANNNHLSCCIVSWILLLLRRRFAYRNFIGGGCGNSICEQGRETGSGREKRWTVIWSQLRAQAIPRGSRGLEWPFTVVLNWGQELGCVLPARTSPLEEAFSP